MKKSLPNIILIVCDTLGAKHMSLYGYERPTTPCLEKLVEEEGFTAYTRCFAPSQWTSPSHASLFTGLYPSEHGTNVHRLSIDKKLYTLTEILKSMGYHTVGLSNNVLISRAFEYNRGFDRFYEPTNVFCEEDFGDITREIFPVAGKFNKLFNVLRNLSAFDKKKLIKFLLSKGYTQIRNPVRNTTPYTLRTLHLALKNIMDFHFKKEKFFLFMNIMQTHHHYNAPKKFRDMFASPKKHLKFEDCLIENYCGDILNLNQSIEYWQAKYDEEVLFLDRALFFFYEKIKKTGHLKNTIVIITSDHGELFGEMGHFMHMFTTYNSITHIPLVIKFRKGDHTDGNIDDRLTQLNDLFATVLDVLEVPFPKPVSSFSLLSSEKRRYTIAQDFYSILKANQFLKKYPTWNFKTLDFFHSNMSFLIELNNVLYKIIYYSNGKFEFYKLSDNLYENKEYYPNKKELRKLQSALYEPHLTIDQFVQSLSEDEKTTLSVKKVS